MCIDGHYSLTAAVGTLWEARQSWAFLIDINNMFAFINIS